MVAIQDPRSDGYAVTVALTDSFAVTSGGYQRYYTAPDGTVYQHILDPKTGYPVESDLLSVSILCDNGTMADAYSTALYVMGSAGAQAFWRTHGGFEMILITTAGKTAVKRISRSRSAADCSGSSVSKQGNLSPAL